MYQTIGVIVVNQGLTAEDFNIDFPVGTEVWDEIQDRSTLSNLLRSDPNNSYRKRKTGLLDE